MQTKIFTCLVLATLLLTQCKKHDIVTTKTEKEQSLVQQAKAFVKEQAPAEAFSRLNWAKAHIFKKEGQAVYLHIPVSNQQAAAGEAIYLKYDNTTFSGNYFSINKAPGGSYR
jgi:DnaJ-class molecular chaperone